MMQINKIKKILKKKNKQPITCLTSYTKSVAQIVDKYCDIILVGDSVGTALYGMKSTKKVNISTMILHAKSVVQVAKNSLVVVDMPYKTYNNKFQAYNNATKIINSTKCDAVKLEGGKNISEIISYLVYKKIPVMGHVGFLPQYANSKFNLKGKNKLEREKILNDAISIEKAGVFAVVIECVVENLAREITNKISIPTIGIGASKYCDGQVLVIDDLIGLSGFYPKFVKKYSNVSSIIDKSVKRYCIDVRKRNFPKPKNIYK